MRFVGSEERMPHDFVAAGSEALRAFGDSSLYLEKHLVRPRHIEIQIMADRHGSVIHLGERECSVQRRHQKVLEECPSPLLDDRMRSEMAEVAIRVARAAHYENAGTMEFLVDQEHNFYFLEMNTRLQVEHPITEAVTGLDIVCEQFRIAAGEPLSWKQEDVQMRGWAIECRVCAEDPDREMAPSPGPIRRMQEPQGPGVRLDSGVYQGWEVAVHYDPLLSKLVAFGADRAQTIARMKRALQEYRIVGVKTNIPLFLELLSNPEFVAGRTHTGLIEELRRDAGHPRGRRSSSVHSHALAAALAYADSDQDSPRVQRIESGNAWKLSGRPGFLPANES